MTLAIILFAVTYICLIAFPKVRAYVALISATLFIALGILPVGKLFSAIDWNVILMIFGTMGIVAFFVDSKMPALLADMILDKMPDVRSAIIALALFAGIISAFVDNVATVLMVAPVALDISKKLKISPVVPIISIAISSNLQGAATLVGDTTSILLGGYAKMNFLDFIIFQNRPGLFFIVQIGAILSALVLFYLFRKQRLPICMGERTIVKDYVPTIIMVLTVVFLILASFLPKKPHNINGYICVGLFLTGLVREVFKRRFSFIKATFKDIDYFTLLLLAGLFVVIAGITEAGVITEVSRIFVRISNNNIFGMYTLLVWASVIFSAFIDNKPYVATMLPVTAGIAQIMGINPTVLYFGLLAGATLGGNLTPIGASANIAGLGILRKEGHEVKATEFMKISIPFTLAAVISGYILIWLFWGILS